MSLCRCSVAGSVLSPIQGGRTSDGHQRSCPHLPPRLGRAQHIRVDAAWYPVLPAGRRRQRQRAICGGRVPAGAERDGANIYFTRGNGSRRLTTGLPSCSCYLLTDAHDCLTIVAS